MTDDGLVPVDSSWPWTGTACRMPYTID